MARGCREPHVEPTTRDVIYRTMYPWHFPNQAEDGANTLPPGVDTHITTKSDVTPRGGRSKRWDAVDVGKPEIFSLSHSAFYNSTTVYKNFNYSNPTPPAAVISLIEHCSDMMDKPQSMIPPGRWKSSGNAISRLMLQASWQSQFPLPKIRLSHTSLGLRTTMCTL